MKKLIETAKRAHSQQLEFEKLVKSIFKKLEIETSFKCFFKTKMGNVELRFYTSLMTIEIVRDNKQIDDNLEKIEILTNFIS